MARLTLATIILIALLAPACSNSKRGFDPAPYRLCGTWEESYSLSMIGVGIPEDPGSGTYDAYFVSRITFTDTEIHIRTYTDSVSEQTLGFEYVGEYAVRGDTLVLLPPRDTVPQPPYYLYFRLEGDRLWLAELGVPGEDGMMIVRMVGLPWQNGSVGPMIVDTKRSGSFTRLSG